MPDRTSEEEFDRLADTVYEAMPEGQLYEALADSVATAVIADGWVSGEAHEAAVYAEHEKHVDAIKRAERADAETAEWKRIATGFETLLNRYKRDNRIGTQVSDALLRVRELAAKMKSESGQSWNSVSGQRILNALAGESNG